MAEIIEGILPPDPKERTSARLRRVLDAHSHDKVRVGHLIAQLHHRSFGGLFLLLGTLALLPGVSFFAALAMLIPALQMTIGLRIPYLPRFLRQREVSPEMLRKYADKVLLWLEWTERYVKPRWSFCTEAPVINLVGVIMVALAFLIMLPLPFSNLPPAIALVCLSLGLLERDGMMVAVGMAAALLVLFIGAVIVTFAADATILLGREYFGWSR